MVASLANGKFFPKVGVHSSHQGAWQADPRPASDHIKNLETGCKVGREAQVQLQNVSHDLDATRREMETLRNENHHIFQEMQHYREQARPQTATAMHPQPPQYAPPPGPVMGDLSRSLPPLTNGIAAPSSMQGVQYSDAPR